MTAVIGDPERDLHFAASFYKEMARPGYEQRQAWDMSRTRTVIAIMARIGLVLPNGGCIWHRVAVFALHSDAVASCVLQGSGGTGPEGGWIGSRAA